MTVSAFRILALSPPGILHPGMPAAAARAGATGVFNAELPSEAGEVLERIAAGAKGVSGGLGLRLGALPVEHARRIISELPEAVEDIILSPFALADSGELKRLAALTARKVWAEVTTVDEARLAAAAGVAGLIAKGNEAGGWVGEETAFVLLQRLLRESPLPVLAFGGIGLHSAAACYAGGAAGVVLESQLFLVRESALPTHVRTAVARMDGSETAVLTDAGTRKLRVYRKGKSRAAATGTSAALELPVDWSGSAGDSLWPVGQDACMARRLADRFVTTAGIIDAIRAAIATHVKGAAASRTLAPGSALALSHGTEYPVVQGAMTRVSDRAEFAQAVAKGGALPFLALALMRRDEAGPLLEETARLLDGQPWGVGLLGFAPQDIRDEQLELVRSHRPPFALIAGGRPDQSQALERQGTATYLHVPSPALLKLFLEDGARRFVFEGRECGGHVGPRSSFVLWNEMIDVILDNLPERETASCHVLFAGGVHDSVSSAMVAAMAAPLAARGGRAGVLVGTGYLFTAEAVATGAITEGFQRRMQGCADTTLLETGPGHAIRIVPTPYADEFNGMRQELSRAGKSANEIRDTLESLNVGRLRVASKGLVRDESALSQERRLRSVTEDEALRSGMYMAGQVAAMHSECTTIRELHAAVTERAESIIAESARGLEDSVGVERHPPPLDVAIIGISCILPGSPDLEAYWKRLLEKRSAVTEVPASRWDWRLYFDPDRSARDRSYSRWGGFIEPVPFDPLEFGMPPNSLKSIEPLQLLALVAARDALRDAGYERRPFDRSRTGAIFGYSGATGDHGGRYVLRTELPHLFGPPAAQIVDASSDLLPEWTEDSLAGILPNVNSGRVANRLDFGGPNYSVDAACASSLASVQAAVHELENGFSDVMLAGGVDNTNNAFSFVAFSKTQALSPTGGCHTFDASADGIAISEGLVMLVLKRLKDAERDGDRIYAVIRGIGSSSDGRAKGLTAPRPEGQMLALQRAYANAGFSPATVGCFEAHGTGTVVGDRTEVRTLGEFLENAGARPNSVAIGSAKSIIGHTKAAAGLAGIAKAALALHRKVLPPTGGVTTPNSDAGFGSNPLYVNSEARPWIHGDSSNPRRMGVSAFGFGGTNFHAVLEEYASPFDEAGPAHRGWPAELFLWSGSSSEDLRDRLSRWRGMLEASAGEPLRNLAFTACQDSELRPDSDDARLGIVAVSAEDLREKIEAAVRALAEQRSLHDPRGVYLTLSPLGRRGSVAFLFPGQGSQYPNMLGWLAMQFSPVRTALERADRYLADRLPRLLSSYVFPPPGFSDEAAREQARALTDTGIAQPALGATCVGMHRLLSDLGIRPDMTGGHSYGEYTALFAAGAMDEETLLRLSEARGRAIQECSGDNPGTMAAVAAPADDVVAIIDGLPDVWLANRNAPKQCVIAGTNEAVSAAQARLGQAGVACRPIAVACAFHTPLVAPARDELLDELRHAPLRKPEKPVFSNSSGRVYDGRPDEMAVALADHLVQPVRFMDEIEGMYGAGARIFVEVGPRNVLTSLTRSILEGREHVVVATDSGAGSQPAALLHAVGQLAVQGLPLRTALLFEGRAVRSVDVLGERKSETRPPAAWMVTPHWIRPRDSAELPAMSPPLESWLRTSAPALPDGNGAPVPSPSIPGGLLQAGNRAEALLRAASTPTELDNVMQQFQAVMQKALEVQQSVMLAYLGGDPALASIPLEPATGVRSEEPNTNPESAPGTGNGRPAIAAAGSADLAIAADSPALLAELLRIVSERTGYPVDVIAPDADLEAELGIDSIKRTEIVGALRSAIFAGAKGTLEMEALSNARTARSIADLFAAQHVATVAIGGASGSAASGNIAIANEQLPTLPAIVSGDLTTAAAQPLRQRLTVVRQELGESAAVSLKDLTFALTDDGTGIATALGEKLRAMGANAVVIETDSRDGPAGPVSLSDFESVAAALDGIRSLHGRIAGVIHLLPLRKLGDSPPSVGEWRSIAAGELKGLVHLLKAASVDLRKSANAGFTPVVAAASMGDHWWLSEERFRRSGPDTALRGGIPAILKTTALEWRGVSCRAVDVDPDTSAERITQWLLDELTHPDGDIQVAYGTEGRVAVRAESLAPDEVSAVPRKVGRDDQQAVGPGSVVLATGGARGITAEILCALAKTTPNLKLIVAGRSPKPAESESAATANLLQPADVKRWLLASRRKNRESVELAAVEASYRAIVQEREIRRNLRRLSSVAASVEYVQLDVTDERATRTLIDSARERHGSIDVVIHAAGAIDDRLIENKSSESFDSVFDPKACGAYSLVRALDSAPPSSLFLFSSSAAAFGSRGQCDYAAANAILNTLALYCSERWGTRVTAIGWGPWDEVGMVSPELRNQMRAQGISLLSLADGTQAFLRELSAAPQREHVIIVSHPAVRDTEPGGRLPRQLRQSASRSPSAQLLS